MADPRDPQYRRPGDPLYDQTDPLARDQLPAQDRSTNAVWGWVAGILVVIAILAVVSMRTTDSTVANNRSSSTTETTGAAPPRAGTLSSRAATGTGSGSMTTPQQVPSANSSAPNAE